MPLQPRSRAGKLNHRLQLQSATEARDAHGQAVKTWSTQATVWGSVEPLRGREYLLARQVASVTTVRVTIRHRSDINTDWRIVFDSPARYLDIVSVIDPESSSRYLELMCEEVE